MVSARARAFTQSRPSETYRYGGEIRAQTANNRIPRCWRPRRDDRLSGELPRRPAAVRVPSCSRPSRTLRAATRCPSGLLDRRRARRLWRPQVGTKKRFAQAEQRSDPRIKRCADLADSCAAIWTGLSPPLTVGNHRSDFVGIALSHHREPRAADLPLSLLALALAHHPDACYVHQFVHDRSPAVLCHGATATIYAHERECPVPRPSRRPAAPCAPMSVYVGLVGQSAAAGDERALVQAAVQSRSETPARWARGR